MCALTLPLPPTLRARWQPWYIAKQKGAFAAAGIELEYTDYPGGTGAMTKALNDNALDVAILLTEGCVKDIATGGAHKIVAVTRPVCLCSCDQQSASVCLPPRVPAGRGPQSRSQCVPSPRFLPPAHPSTCCCAGVCPEFAVLGNTHRSSARGHPIRVQPRRQGLCQNLAACLRACAHGRPSCVPCICECA